MVNTLPQNTHLGMVYNSHLYIDKVMTGVLDALGDGLWHCFTNMAGCQTPHMCDAGASVS